LADGSKERKRRGKSTRPPSKRGAKKGEYSKRKAWQVQGRRLQRKRRKRKRLERKEPEYHSPGKKTAV